MSAVDPKPDHPASRRRPSGPARSIPPRFRVPAIGASPALILALAVAGISSGVARGQSQSGDPRDWPNPYVALKGTKDRGVPTLVICTSSSEPASLKLREDLARRSRDFQSLGVTVTEMDHAQFTLPLERIGVREFPTLILYAKDPRGDGLKLVDALQGPIRPAAVFSWLNRLLVFEIDSPSAAPSNAAPSSAADDGVVTVARRAPILNPFARRQQAEPEPESEPAIVDEEAPPAPAILSEPPVEDHVGIVGEDGARHDAGHRDGHGEAHGHGHAEGSSQAAPAGQGAAPVPPSKMFPDGRTVTGRVVATPQGPALLMPGLENAVPNPNSECYVVVHFPADCCPGGPPAASSGAAAILGQYEGRTAAPQAHGPVVEPSSQGGGHAVHAPGSHSRPTPQLFLLDDDAPPPSKQLPR